MKMISVVAVEAAEAAEGNLAFSLCWLSATMLLRFRLKIDYVS